MFVNLFVYCCFIGEKETERERKKKSRERREREWREEKKARDRERERNREGKKERVERVEEQVGIRFYDGLLFLVGRKEGNVSFNDALNTFYLLLYGAGFLVDAKEDALVKNVVKGNSIV